MALVYVGGTAADGTSADYAVSLTGLTGGIASAPDEGDIVIVVTGFASTSNLDPGVTTAGYTEECDLWQDDTRDSNLAVCWKIMGSTPDTSVTVKGSTVATAGASTVVHVWRGVDQATPMDVARTVAQAPDASNPNAPAITPVTAGAVVIACGMGAGGTQDTTATVPSGYSNHVYRSSTDPGIVSYAGIASKAWSGSGAEDPGAWSGINTSTSDAWCACTLALRPAGAVVERRAKAIAGPVVPVAVSSRR